MDAAPVCRLCGEKAELNSDDVCFDCWGGDAYKARLAEAARAAERPAATALESPRPELWSSAAEGIGREGVVTVWDEQGRYVGCMGVELWRWLLTTEADRG